MNIKVGDEVEFIRGYSDCPKRKVVGILDGQAIYEVPESYGYPASNFEAKWQPYLKEGKRYLKACLTSLVVLKRGNQRIPRRYT